MIAYSTYDISNVQYKNSDLVLLQISFSTGNISNVEVSSISSPQHLLYFRSTTIQSFNDSSFSNSDTTNHAILMTQSALLEANNITVGNINSTALFIENSEVGIVSSLNITQSDHGIFLSNSILERITNSIFSKIRNVNVQKASAFYGKNSNFSITNTVFMNNLAIEGSSMYIDCINSKYQ